MKIAISATGASLDAEVDPRFGRCPYFIAIDLDSMEFESLENSNMAAAGGAGISTAQMIANKGVEVVLTGNCGPNAYQTLSAAGVQVITGVTGVVRNAVEAYKAGKLQPSGQASVGAHYGMGMGTGRGMGRGMGMGMGRGTGMGMGLGMPPASGAMQGPVGPDQETEMLKNQAEILGQQLSEIQRRLEELEKKGR
ncbi:MAG: NifB/NifX family molybdenum-iron cluster-binding protein [Dehalococcoidia bacterium]|nr:NifB/NifX family molybdenum-iron cluster-binding protein [Chloroflexota bacterium]MCK4221426.1 NifB/NifX family molybdenum-iron cluster-binding protein [Dehalococcoidia bacterium]MCK4262452.1 NifB/NifX family molybdenum-iron cluster-binding protein [Dehalococcoidia bacterium]